MCTAESTESAWVLISLGAAMLGVAEAGANGINVAINATLSVVARESLSMRGDFMRVSIRISSDVLLISSLIAL